MIHISKIKKDWICILYAFLLFLSSNPYFGWGTNLSMLCILLCSILSLANFRMNQLSLFYLILYVCIFIRLTQFPIGVRIIRCLPVLILFTSKTFLYSAFMYYKKILAFFLIPSLIVYCLLLLGFNLNYDIIEPLNIIKEYNYREYFLLVVPNITSILSFRFCGLFDEPGVIGTLCIILLYLGYYNLKKWYNLVFFIAGIFSFSLFFYLLSFGYALFYLRLNLKWIAFIAVVLIITSILINNEVADSLIYKRIEIKNGNLSGNNRENASFEKWYEKFVGTPEYFLGLGGGVSSMKYNVGGASYKDLIVDYGIMFYLFYISGVIFTLLQAQLTLKRKLLYIAAFMGIIFQRPFICDYIYVFLMFSFVLFYKNIENEKVLV